MEYFLNNLGRSVVSLALTMALCATAHATYIYTYTGNPFNDFRFGASCPPDCAITGSFTVSQALGANLSFNPSVGNVSPLAFSFTMGTNTVTEADASFQFFSMGTDASGNISNWVVGLFDSTSTLLLATDSHDNFGNTFDEFEDFTSVSSPFAQIQNNPGTWSASAVPEPGSSATMLFGLGMLGFMVRRRRAS